MLEKNKKTDEVTEIAFNWERVKKKAASKREELVANNPNIQKRPIQMNTTASPVNNEHLVTNPATTLRGTDTTDTITDPYYNIQDKLSDTSMKAFKDGTNKSHLLDNNVYGTDKSSLGTDKSQLLPRPAGQEEYSLVVQGDESLGPDRNAVTLLKALKLGETTGKELTIDERRLVVTSMKELGQTQDAIADLLKVSRRTIVNDYKVLRQEQALSIAKTETHEVAGEVYSTAKTCIRRALAAGSFKTVSVIMRDMVETLQSLGVLYRAPKTSMQATGHFDLPGRNKGYQQYMDTIGEDKNKVIDALDCMFSAIDNGTLTDR